MCSFSPKPNLLQCGLWLDLNFPGSLKVEIRSLILWRILRNNKVRLSMSLFWDDETPAYLEAPQTNTSNS